MLFNHRTNIVRHIFTIRIESRLFFSLSGESLDDIYRHTELVGVVQINFTVPFAAALGVQLVVVSVGGVGSQSATLTLTQWRSSSPQFRPLRTRARLARNT